MAQEYGTQRRPRRRGRGLLTTLIVLLIVVGGILLAADRFGASAAERRIGEKVAQQVASQKAHTDQPKVTIEGFPFLTQVAAGKYREIRIELPNFSGPAGNGKTIKLPVLDARAQDVRASLNTLRAGGSIVAGSVSGTGTIDYAQLTTLIGQSGLKLGAKDGKLVASAPVQALGQTFVLSGTADLTVANGLVKVRFVNIDASGLPNVPVIKSLITAYADKLSLDLRIPPLPLKLVVQKVQPLAEGLRFTAGATNVTLNSGGL